MTINRAFSIAALIIFILAALPGGFPQLTMACVGLACLAASQIA